MRVSYNGSTSASQALDVGSIPITRSNLCIRFFVKCTVPDIPRVMGIFLMGKLADARMSPAPGGEKIGNARMSPAPDCIGFVFFILVLIFPVMGSSL